MTVVTRNADDWCALAGEGNLVALCATMDDPGTGEYAIEAKLDGWRLLAVVCEDAVRLFARSGQQLTGKLPHIEDALSAFPVGTVFDGEAVALRALPEGGFVNEWGIAQSVLSTLGPNAAAERISFVLFDLLAHAGIDARTLPYVTRRKLLERTYASQDTGGVVQLVPSKVASGLTLAHLHGIHLSQGFEGSVLKPLQSVYGSGKRRWFRLKPQDTTEYVVIGFKPGQGSFEGMVGAVIFGAYDEHGKLVEQGRCSGFDVRTRRHMTDHPEQWIGTVIEVAHFKATKPGGKVRSPQMKRRRPDRIPEEITL